MVPALPREIQQQQPHHEALYTADAIETMLSALLRHWCTRANGPQDGHSHFGLTEFIAEEGVKGCPVL